jgi:hypothetical protein
MAEHPAHNGLAVGSSPTVPTKDTHPEILAKGYKSISLELGACSFHCLCSSTDRADPF